MQNIRKKKHFLAQPRDTTIPILQRCQTKDKYSQKCQIIREEGEGCSGSSRGLPNIVIPIENAAIDQYSSEFNNIIEGTDVNHEYHSSSTQIGYHQLHYDSVTNEYKLKKMYQMLKLLQFHLQILQFHLQILLEMLGQVIYFH